VLFVKLMFLLQIFQIRQLKTLRTHFMLISSFHTLKWNSTICRLKSSEHTLKQENRCMFSYA